MKIPLGVKERALTQSAPGILKSVCFACRRHGFGLQQHWVWAKKTKQKPGNKKEKNQGDLVFIQLRTSCDSHCGRGQDM